MILYLGIVVALMMCFGFHIGLSGLVNIDFSADACASGLVGMLFRVYFDWFAGCAFACFVYFSFVFVCFAVVVLWCEFWFWVFLLF